MGLGSLGRTYASVGYFFGFNHGEPMAIADFVAGRGAAYALTCALAASGAIITGCSGPNSSLQSPTVLPHSVSGSSPIQHVVIVIQENRSFDNLFDCFKGTACVKKGKEKVLEGTKVRR
jgi:phospholipase C